MFYRRVVLFLVCACPLSQLEAAPPWKRAYRAQRDVMRAQLEYQQAASGASKQMYQQQKQSLRQQEKYMKQDYRAGGPPTQYAYPSRRPAAVIAVPVGVPVQSPPRAAYSTPHTGPTRSTAGYRIVPPHAVPARAPTHTYSTNRVPAAPARVVPSQQTPPQQANRRYSSNSNRASATVNSSSNVVRRQPVPSGPVVTHNTYDSRGQRIYAHPTGVRQAPPASNAFNRPHGSASVTSSVVQGQRVNAQPIVVRPTTPATNYSAVRTSVPSPNRIVETRSGTVTSPSSVMYSTPQSFQNQPPVAHEVVHEPAYTVVNPAATQSSYSNVQPAVESRRVVTSPKSPNAVPARQPKVVSTSVTQEVPEQLPEQLPELVPVPLAESHSIKPEPASDVAVDHDPQPTPAKRPGARQ